MSGFALEIQDLSVGYGKGGRSRVVLEGMSGRVRAGELACLIGVNGAGKSTLLRTLMGFQPPLGGRVLLDESATSAMAPAEIARRLAIVLTERVSVGQLRASELVAVGRYPHTGWTGGLSEHDQAVISQSIEAAGATALANRIVAELSDGERQRVMIARALAQEPDVLLLDEPTAFLDLRGRLDLITVLRRLTRERGLAVIMATHDLEHAFRYSDQIWLIDEQRRLVTGAPEDLGLEGALERAVAGSNGAYFDAETGTFRLEAIVRGVASVSGEGPVRHWTEKALERAGYRNGPEHEADICIQCALGTHAVSWRLKGSDEEVDSLAALVNRVSTFLHSEAPPA